MTKHTNGTEEQCSDYLAYLLRLWRMRSDGATGWRASLVSPGNDERQVFASLEELFGFLRRQTGARAQPEDAKDTRQ